MNWMFEMEIVPVMIIIEVCIFGGIPIVGRIVDKIEVLVSLGMEHKLFVVPELGEDSLIRLQIELVVLSVLHLSVGFDFVVHLPFQKSPHSSISLSLRLSHQHMLGLLQMHLRTHFS